MMLKFSEWSKKKNKENDNKNLRTNSLKYGKKESKRLVLQSDNSISYKKILNKKNKTRPKSVWYKQPKQQLKTEWK